MRLVKIADGKYVNPALVSAVYVDVCHESAGVCCIKTEYPVLIVAGDRSYCPKVCDNREDAERYADEYVRMLAGDVE